MRVPVVLSKFVSVVPFRLSTAPASARRVPSFVVGAAKMYNVVPAMLALTVPWFWNEARC